TGQGQFAPNTSVETRVGAGADAAVNEYFDGKISEIILFKKDINEAQRTIVNNYIAAKYNVSIGGYARYALGVTYGFDVAGIGQASDGSSHSSARGTGRVAMSSPAGMGNNEFLMWGNNNADVSSTTSNKPAIATSRLNRIWAFNNGGISTVTMTFDVSGIANADQMQLFYDTNTDFTAGGSLISGSYDATAKTLTFTSVALPSGAGYFTLMVNSDSDGDGVNNDLDNCPNHSNLNQLNTDVLLNNNPDDLGDACDDDDDGDGISDVMENLLDPTGTNSLIPIGGYTDTDGDGAPDNAEGGMIADTDDDNDSVADSFPDNCPLVANPLQTNTDVELNNNPDALGDACDTDIDGDGDLNTPDQDNCPFTINPNQDDLDLDGLGDVCDDDVDGDGRVDNLDNCPLVKNSTQADADGNGYGDVCGKVFVSTSGVTKTGDCSSWALACDDISYAISQAQIDDVAREVFIEAGVYHPAATLSIPAGFSLVGGFNGSEQLATQANSAVNITIISGDVANSLIADVTAKTSASLTTRLIDVFNHGVQAVNEVKLSGLIINAASPSSAIDGGGLRVYSSRVKLSNMQFIANEAANGAALLVDAGSIVKLDHSVFKNNSSANQAGAILLKGNASQLIVTHSLLKANVAVVGGAIYSADSSMLDISDTEFEANDASTSAGAIMLSSTSGQISIKRSSFISNHSDGVAGAISSAGAAGLDITNASFHKNSAEGDGGAIYVNSASGAVSLEYVTLVGNSSATDGGAIYQASASELNIARSLIVGNTAGSEASGHNLYLWDSLKDGGFNLLGFDSKSGVKPEGQFMPEADPNVSSYTGSFTTDVATLDSIVVGVSSYDAGDDVSSVAATRILALTETSVARDVMNLVECGAVIEDQRGQNRQDDSTGMCDIGAHEYTDYTCAEQSQAIRDGGNYYLANCNPANQFVFDFGQLKGLGAMHWYYLCVLSLLLFRPKRLNASQV
ncbi:MAG: thrombospondin type 3 repeat-containing protein, partial [Pseudomonadales bacterium]|nr:thrombospondin type 3 repeat-containing protein [Pseudomonadales bacterium]